MSSVYQEEVPLIVVGVGASAGGLEALELMFDHVAPESRMAFVIVQHLSPDFRSLMDELLARHTQLSIHRVEDGMQVKPGAIYLIPPKKEMIISNGCLLLSDKDQNAQWTLPIDTFFRSLAQDCKGHAVGVILSGTGSDGSAGITRVHEAGGLVIVQSEDSAKFNGMPRSAIDTGVADLVVPPEKIGDLLSRFADNPVRSQFLNELAADSKSEPVLQTVFSAMQRDYGLDFRQYKPGTMLRRLHRRAMMANCATVEDYANNILTDPAERKSLYGDLLIGVTKFFRDRETFVALQEEIERRLVDQVWPEEVIRAWVCGCSTGEEAYTIAMILHDLFSRLDRSVNARIFATDIDRESLEFASLGLYSASVAQEVPPEFLARYFVESPHGFQVVPELRSMITFAQHNALRDAPFTNLHLVTCRNFLIYLNGDAQQKVLSLLCFGLRGKGLLVLGGSESPGESAADLTVVNTAEKIYTKQSSSRYVQRVPGLDLAGLSIPATQNREFRVANAGLVSAELLNVYDLLLAQCMPAAILINQEGLLVQVFGDGARYLSISTGRVSSKLTDLIHKDLKLAVAGLIHRVQKTKSLVAVSRLRIENDGGESLVSLTVSPIVTKTSRLFFLIRLDSAGTTEHPIAELVDADGGLLAESATEQLDELSLELSYTRESLQATIEELETANEELQATNEEMIASNEELQSTNEELHSVNEELYTVNAEHQKKIAELTKLNNDFDNLLASTEIHTVFLDEELNIRLFTPRSVEVFNFTRDDIGRRFDSFTHKLRNTFLGDNLQQVLETGRPIEREVQDYRGRHFLMRIMPYLVVGRSCGVVITMLDMSVRVEWEGRLRESNGRFERAIAATRDGIWDWPDVHKEEMWWSPMCYEILGYEANEIPSRYSEWLALIHPEDRERIRQTTVPHRKRCFVELHQNFEYRMLQKNGEYRWYQHRALAVLDDAGFVVSMTGSVVDIAGRKEWENSLRDQVKRRDEFLAVLSHELRNPLGAITNAISLVSHDGLSDAQNSECCRVIREQSRHMIRLLDDLLDVSKVRHNKLEMRFTEFNLLDTVPEVLAATQSRATASGVNLLRKTADAPVMVLADRDRIIQCQVNLLGNGIKFTPRGGIVEYSIDVEEGWAQIRVRDNGVGMSTELCERVFELFSQGRNEPRSGDSGIGVGLALVRSIAQMHSGTVAATSEGLGKGSLFVLRIPLLERPVSHDVLVPELVDIDFPNRPTEATSKRVLIVDDLPDGRSMLAQLLSLRGFQVVEAEDGRSGLEAAHKTPFDFALIDLGLPDISGVELAREYLSRYPERSTKLIAITGYGQSKDLSDTAEAGFDHHLTKPVDLQRLFSMLSASAR